MANVAEATIRAGALAKEIPVQQNWSLIRHALALRYNLLPHVLELEKRYGRVWYTPMGPGGMISLLGPDALELVLKNRDGAFSSAKASRSNGTTPVLAVPLSLPG